MQNQSSVQITSNDKIFATGVHLQAVQIEINGIKQWRWIAVGFEEDSFFNGENIDVYDYANTFEELINNSDLKVFQS
ncbi:MAG: hypothetical protein Q7U47_11360 [Paludibacter sp.]|nr:hypothetical protein [Paludibacter sp.]